MTAIDLKAHRETFEHFLDRRGLRRTRQRELILDVFLATDDHLTSEELHALVSKEDASIGLATLYRTLKLFVEAGIASERAFGEGVTRYEVRQAHHDHLICTNCGRIIEFEDETIEELQDAIAERHGFTLTWHRLELYGTCPDCPAEAADAPRRGAPRSRPAAAAD
ncbi:MAG: transcriptional repressor [Acidobacteriota bacterium]